MKRFRLFVQSLVVTVVAAMVTLALASTAQASGSGDVAVVPATVIATDQHSAPVAEINTVGDDIGPLVSCGRASGFPPGVYCDLTRLEQQMLAAGSLALVVAAICQAFPPACPFAAAAAAAAGVYINERGLCPGKGRLTVRLGGLCSECPIAASNGALIARSAVTSPP
jgi:hypothetical protein